MATEGVILQFLPDAIGEIAKIAADVNDRIENIGARRLQTVLEKLLEEISFNASERSDPDPLRIDADYVKEQLADIARDNDLSKYIL